MIERSLGTIGADFGFALALGAAAFAWFRWFPKLLSPFRGRSANADVELSVERAVRVGGAVFIAVLALLIAATGLADAYQRFR